MTGTDVAELYKVLGSTAGIISAVFLLIDRVLRHRPLAEVIQDPDRGLWEKSLAVRVTNPSSRVIYLLSAESSHPTYIGVSKDHTWDDVFGRDEAKARILTIEPGSQRLLPIEEFKEGRNGAKCVQLKLRWRRRLGRMSLCWPVKVAINPDLLPGLRTPEPTNN